MKGSVGARLHRTVAWLAFALVLASPSAGVSQNTCAQLRAPQREALGQVCVSYRAGVLTVVYEAAPGWMLLETHLAVGRSLADLPLSESGIPRVGMFPYGDSLSRGARTARYTIALDEVGGRAGEPLVIAAHASVASETGGEQGVWAEGERFVAQGFRATYFSYRVPRAEDDDAASDRPREPSASRSALPAADAPTTGGSRDGTPGPDTLRGGPERDVLFGKEGADLIEGFGGSDWLVGGAGADLVRGQEGDDILEGDAGSDVLEGGPGNDMLSGGPDRDWLFGEDGNDLIRGGAGDDVAEGGGSLADDVQDIGGADIMFGDDGNDNFDGGGGNDVIFGGEGADILDGGDGEDQVHGGPGDDDIEGGDENDVLFGDDGNDSIEGGDGADKLEGGRGRDVLSGGDGNDVINGGDDNDTLVGGSDNDVLSGGAGHDLIGGGKGDDVLLGEAGQDTLFGHLGRDHLEGGADGDLLRGGPGEDLLHGGLGDDVLLPGMGTDVVEGDEGNDTIIVRLGDVDARTSEGVNGGDGNNLLLLHGFSEADLSVSQRTPARPAGDTAAAAAPVLDALITDPWSGGSYRVSRVSQVLYAQRLSAGGSAAAAEVLLLNASTQPARVLRLPGDSMLAAFGVRLVRMASDTAPPLDFAADRPLGARAAVAVAGIGAGAVAQAPVVDAFALPIRIDRAQGRDDGFVVVNASVSAPVKLTLVAAEGGEVESVEAQLAANERLSAPLERFFPRIREFIGTLTVEGEAITGAGIHALGAGRSVALPLIPQRLEGERQNAGAPRAARSMFFPHVAAGAGGTATLIVYNPRQGQANRARGLIRFLDASGAPAAVDLGALGRRSSMPFDVAPLGVVFIDLSGRGERAVVAARVEVTEGEATALVEQWPAEGAPFAYDAAFTHSRFVAAVRRRQRDNLNTLVALQSTGEPARVELMLRDDAGREVRNGRTAVELPASGSVARRLEELFPDAETREFLGSVAGTSTQPVAVSVVQLGRERAGPMPVVRLP